MRPGHETTASDQLTYQKRDREREREKRQRWTIFQGFILWGHEVKNKKCNRRQCKLKEKELNLMFCTTHKPSHGRLWAYSNVLNEYQFPEKKRK